MTSIFRPASLAIALFTTAALVGCSTTKVERVDTKQEVALNDRWNATDSRLVSEEMIADMLTFPWVENFKRQNSVRNPVVIIQNVYNKSAEQIPVETFINDLKRAGIRSGKVDFVASGAQRDAVREERKEQELNARAETASPMGQETGADFALSGTINSIVNQEGDKRVTFYQVDLTLINMRTNREVWAGQKKIKKLQEKSRFGF